MCVCARARRFVSLARVFGAIDRTGVHRVCHRAGGTPEPLSRRGAIRMVHLHSQFWMALHHRLAPRRAPASPTLRGVAIEMHHRAHSRHDRPPRARPPPRAAAAAVCVTARVRWRTTRRCRTRSRRSWRATARPCSRRSRASSTSATSSSTRRRTTRRARSRRRSARAPRAPRSRCGGASLLRPPPASNIILRWGTTQMRCSAWSVLRA